MTARAKMEARGLRTKRNNSPAFRRADLAKRLTARRLRFEREASALLDACGLNYESWAAKHAMVLSARALHNYRRICAIMGWAV